MAGSLDVDIPGLPILVAVAAVAAIVAGLVLRRRRTASAPRLMLVAAWIVYGVGLARSVLFPYPVVLGAAREHLVPWPVFVQTVPLATVPADPSGMVLNVLLFLPLGFLAGVSSRRPSALRAAVTAAVVSLVIELVQLAGDVTISTGRVADVDDLIGNTAGALVGAAFALLALRIPVVARLATAAREGGPGSGAGAAGEAEPGDDPVERPS